MKRLFILLALLCWTPGLVLAAAPPMRVWEGGVDDDWHDRFNWEGDTLPTSSDVAHLDGVSDVNATIDEDIDVLGIQVDNGYGGTLDFDGGGGDPPRVDVGTSGIIFGTGVTVALDRAAIYITGGQFHYLNASTGWTTGTGSVTLIGNCTVTGDSAQPLYDFDTGSGTVTIHSNTDGYVLVTNTCTIGGPLVLDDVLAVTGNGDMLLNEGVSFTGSSYLYVAGSNSTHGLVTLHSSVTAPRVVVHHSVAGTRLAAGTYGGKVDLYASGAADSLLELDSFATYGAYDFDGGLELENSGTGLVMLDNSTNDPTINIGAGGLTIDLDAGGNILIDDTATSVDWDVTGNFLNDDTGAGSFSWAQGTGGTKTFSGTANQTVDSTAVDIGEWIVSKTTSGNLTINDAVLRLGLVDLLGNFTVTGSVVTRTDDDMTFQNAVDFSGGGNTYTKGAGAIHHTGTGSINVDWDGLTIEDMVINRTPGYLTFRGGWTADSFTLLVGSIDFDGNTVITTGDFVVYPGTAFMPTGGGLDGADITVGGSFTATGTASTDIDMTASAWTLDVTGTGNHAQWVNVTNCDASATSPIFARRSIDGTGNTAWIFLVTPRARYSNHSAARLFRGCRPRRGVGAN